MNTSTYDQEFLTEEQLGDAKNFLKEKDVCAKCGFIDCEYCAIYHLKMKFLDYNDPETKDFLYKFAQNLEKYIEKKSQSLGLVKNEQ